MFSVFEETKSDRDLSGCAIIYEIRKGDEKLPEVDNLVIIRVKEHKEPFGECAVLQMESL